MSERGYSEMLAAPPREGSPATAVTWVSAGAGAYRTAPVAVDVMPLPRPPWWFRLQAWLFLWFAGKERAYAQQWYRRAHGGRWSQELNPSGIPQWMPVLRCPGYMNAARSPEGAPCGVCHDPLTMIDWEVMGAEVPPVCHCEEWP